MNSLQSPISRSIYDYIVRSPLIDKLFECLQDRQLIRNICRSGHKPNYGDMDEHLTQVRSSFSISFITGRNEVVAKVMFLQVSVCPQGGGCLPQCMLGCQTPPGPGRPPRPGRPTPTRQTPPDQADPPRTRQTPPRPGRPPREADSSIRSTSGRYASYWNAFLLNMG